ncbi:hypothetical protein G6O69_10040 [Pseudenhygromyxa sp. WMMC2535]|uniref:hypothetical protein n=1 Tax=Pseudenhygromyxa sp. WMMC2535 TaxID=2712867 RepID=UPI0015520940|nr:hypothetical protein [Pseudenhygromyxa sp. WMMC2535]NVB38172.1 hypothetical protein [Pseudenhygromyxa sp. WMMC2535]
MSELLSADARAAIERLARARLLNPGFAWHLLAAEDPRALRPAVIELLARGLEGDGVALTLRCFDETRLDAVEGCLDALFADPPAARQLFIVDLSALEPAEARRGYDLFAMLNGRRDLARASLRGEILLCVPAWLEPVLHQAAPDLGSGIRSALLRRPPLDPGPALAQWWADADARFDALLRETPGAQERYACGTYTFAYAFEPDAVALPLADTLELLRALPGYTGWRTWWVPSGGFAPHVHEGALECWIFGDDQRFADPGHSDFWRVNGHGRAYLRRGFEEDSYPQEFPPRSRLSNSLPVWRAGEALLHARDFAHAHGLASHHSLGFRARWQGLRGRTLSAWPEGPLAHVQPASSHQDEVVAEHVFRVADLEDDLSAAVEQLCVPLFECFDLHRPTRQFIAAHLDRLMKRSA